MLHNAFGLGNIIIVIVLGMSWSFVSLGLWFLRICKTSGLFTEIFSMQFAIYQKGIASKVWKMFFRTRGIILW